MAVEDRCETFEILKQTKGLKQSTCPFSRICDGTSCDMLKENRIKLREDEEQERRILYWKASQRKN